MKLRDRRAKQEARRPKLEKKGTKQDVRTSLKSVSSSGSSQGTHGISRGHSKRSGVEAVKLHIQMSGCNGRSSRSATAVRKTSLRMTAIKEYPFDLSDLQNQPNESDSIKTEPQGTPSNLRKITPITRVSTPDGKRKVSIMADETSKDRENNVRNESRDLSHSPQLAPPLFLSHARSKRTRIRPRSSPPTTQDPNGRVSSSADGPSRRKSNLHNAMASEMDTSWDRPAHIEGRYKKYSTTSSVYSKKALSHHSDHIERSWWYACCQKCHQEDSGIPSWEPPLWRKICPYPLCPTYRQFAQTLSVFIIGILVWLTIWIIMGNTAAPGGQLFMLALLAIAGYLGGWLMVKITTLPALIGVLIVGIVLKNVGFVNFDQDYEKVCTYIRKLALTIILTRAGLDLDPVAMKKFFFTVIKLALVPWTFECILSAVMANLLLDLPWDWAFLLGSIIAAVSPAVIVPCLFRLREKGYGVSKGIPTLVLAVSGIDDAASVAIFGIVAGVMFSTSSLTMNIVKGPLSIIGGVLFGVLCGYLTKYVPEKNDAFLVPLRVLLLLTGGVVSVLGSEEIGWEGAGPLAVIAFAFVACKSWTEQGWELDDNPVATAFEIFWMFFEPMLFAVTGAQVVITTLPLEQVLIGTGILVTCAVLRAFVTSVSAVRSNLNTKEKIFVGLAWMAKATVQAALGPVAIDEVKKLVGENPSELEVLEGYAKTVFTICIMSIVITAPIGAIIITVTGPRLLSKTTKPPVLEGWRRSHRPSIRDISIIDEEEIAERDAERQTAGDDHTSLPGTPIPPVANSSPATAITVQPNHHTT